MVCEVSKLGHAAREVVEIVTNLARHLSTHANLRGEEMWLYAASNIVEEVPAEDEDPETEAELGPPPVGPYPRLGSPESQIRALLLPRVSRDSRAQLLTVDRVRLAFLANQPHNVRITPKREPRPLQRRIP